MRKKKQDGESDLPEDVTGLLEGPQHLYMPVTRAYTAPNGDWLVQGRAISDVVHPAGRFKTMFDYPSAKEAFKRWRGNVREQHNPEKAVARGIDWTPNDSEKAIDMVARVSKGAPDTWAKLQDDVLTGFSIHLLPGFKTDWVTVNGERVLRYSDYDFLEISLVDAPGIPGCEVSIVRANGFVNDEVVDIQEAPETPAESETPAPLAVQAVAQPSEVERAGAAVSAERMGRMHAARDSALSSARQMLSACPCDECQAMADKLDPDQDGDVDLDGSAADTDNDAEALVERVLRSVMPRILEELQPSVQRYQAIAGTLSRISDPDLSPVTRALGDITTQVSGLTTQLDALSAKMQAQDGLHAELSEVKGLVQQIHEQPIPGQHPVLRARDLGLTPETKRLATDLPPATSQMSDAEAMRRVGQLGLLKKPSEMTAYEQTQAAYAAIQPIQRT